DLLRREPADRRVALGLPQLALARAPIEHHTDQQKMEADALIGIAADEIMRRQHAQRLRLDAGLLQKLALGAFGDGLADLETAAGKAPLPDVDLLAALDQQASGPAPHRGEDPDPGTLGIAPAQTSVAAASPSSTL